MAVSMKNLCSSETFLKAKEFSIENRLITPGKKVIAAVSGGSDSVFLLYFLLCLKKDFELGLSVCHFDHGLREDSSFDLNFVKRLAEKFNLDFYWGRGDVRSFARKHNISIEMAARSLRYSFFNSLIKTGKGDTIALGHNMTDSIETFFLNIYRGTGVRGLKGIRSMTSHIIRPLLVLKKGEIERELNRRNIKYIVDSTNFELEYKRNRVRKFVLPSLQKVFGEEVEKRFFVLFENINSSIDGCEYFVEQFFKKRGIVDQYGARLNLEEMRRLPLNAFKEVVFFVFDKFKGTTYGISRDFLSRFYDFVLQGKRGLRRLFTNDTLFAAKTKKWLFIFNESLLNVNSANSFNVKGEGEYKIPFGFSYIIEHCNTYLPSKEKTSVYIKKSLLSSSLKIERIDFEGDYIMRNGNCYRDLKKYFKKKGMSLFERKNTFVLKNDNEVLFIPGYFISESISKINCNQNLIKVYIKDALG